MIQIRLVQFVVFIKEDMEKRAIDYLKNNGNKDVIYILSANIANVHYFTYRIGTKYIKSSNKVFNIASPIQSLIYNEHKELSGIWKKDEIGFIIK